MLDVWQPFTAFPDRPLSADAADGPFADGIARLDGTGAGRVLQSIVERWLDTGRVLPHRTKLLILAVVAYGLSQEALTAKVRTRLAEQHGGSANDFEAAVKRVRKHTQSLSRNKTIAGIAAIGISNSLARLGTLEALAPTSG